MERAEQLPEKDTRSSDYSEANDQSTHMTEMEKCINKLETQGFTDQLKVEKGKLLDLTNGKKYKPKEVKAVNFFRFEGITDPDDTSILYAIEITDGSKGTLIDAYGTYSDDDITAFMQEVTVDKKTTKS